MKPAAPSSQDLVLSIRKGKTDLSGADLRFGDLWNADLSYGDLWNAKLKRADFRNADLRGAKLDRPNLEVTTEAPAPANPQPVQL